MTDYVKCRVGTGEMLDNPGPVPSIIDGLADTDLADLSFLPAEHGFGGIGYWPLENNDQAFDPDTEILDDTTLTYTPVTSQKVVKTRRTKRSLTEEELIARRPPPPNAISDRQFAQQIAIEGLITQNEAIAWVASGTIPTTLQAVVDQLPDTGPDGLRFTAQMLLSGATIFERNHPMTGQLIAALGMTSSQVDDIWREAALL